MTIPVATSLVLAGISFSASVFVILRIVIPILPPHPLSKRVSPSEFGLPRFLKLSTGDKCHLWLAGLDIVALVLLVWQVFDESLIGPTGPAVALDPASTMRLWIIVTLRQTCLMVITALILLHLRMAQSMGLGRIHWMVWSPVILLTITSATIAGLLAGRGVDYLFCGLIAYSSTVAILTTAAFGCLIRTLMNVKRNLAALDEATNSWPPPEVKARPSFATEDIDAIKDGASWITSETGSHRNSASAWSFSTQQTTTTQSKSQSKWKRPSILTRSSISAGSRDKVPPVPPLPSSYDSASWSPAIVKNSDPDPFRRNPPHPEHPRQQFGSQSSWLTSTAGLHTTVSEWSLPATKSEGPSIRCEHSLRSPTPDARTLYSPSPVGFVDARSLSGYGYSPSPTEALQEEEGVATLSEVQKLLQDFSYFAVIGWSLLIWLPFICLFPYLVYLSQRLSPPTSVQIFYILSVTISSPLLTLNLLLKCPLPISVGLFESKPKPTPDTQSTFLVESYPPVNWSRQARQSSATSVTVVECRRSGDVWISQGDAVDGKSKLGRAVSMLSTTPKLSVLPPEDGGSMRVLSPLSRRDDSFDTVCATPTQDTNSRYSRSRSESRCESRNSEVDEHAALGSKIMVAQRHYSTLAQTMVVPPSPGNSSTTVTPNTPTGASTGAKRAATASHLRSRSINALSPPAFSDRAQCCPSPPPSFPLPPTPPRVRAARLAMLSHKKSFSCSASAGNTSSISCRFLSPSAVVPPALLPRRKICGEDTSVDDVFQDSSRKKDEKRPGKKLGKSDDFSSPQVPSASSPDIRPRNDTHERNQYSLPRLDKKKLQSLTAWSSDVRRALDEEISNNISRSNSAVEAPPTRSLMPFKSLDVVKKGNRSFADHPLRDPGLSTNAPGRFNPTRNSASTMDVPRSVTSSVTLLEDFEGGLRTEPQAQSTPRSSVSSRHHHCPRTPMPLPSHQRRQSTIRYISSENSQPRKYPLGSSEDELSIGSNEARRGARAILPLVPKAGANSGRGLEPPKGLRPLTLLDYCANIDNGLSAPKKAVIRPLVIGKRQDRARVQVLTDENGSPSRSKHLRKLTMGRSDSVKQRGALRQNEILPAVVVRPPSEGSEGSHYPFNYPESD